MNSFLQQSGDISKDHLDEFQQFIEFGDHNRTSNPDFFDFHFKTKEERDKMREQ